MSSNTMNFGPEWMRRLSKSNAPGSADLTTRASTNNSTVPTNPSVVTSTPGGGNSSNSTFSYSSVAANSRTNSRRNTLTQFEGLEEELRTPTNEGHFVDQLNPFKYSKEYMLSLYKPVGLPLDFEKHEYVTSDDCLPPMASIDLTDQEKKLLSGSVNSDLTRRIVHQSASSGHTRGERGSHRGGISGMGRGRGGSSHNKESFRDEEKLDQARFSKSIMLRENVLGSNLDEAMWSNVTRHAVGTFDSDGVFRFGGENVGDALESLESLKISDDQFEQDQGALMQENLFRNPDQETSNASHQEAQQHSQRLNRAILSLGGNSGDDRTNNDRPINIVEALSKKPDNERSSRDAFSFGGHGGASPPQSPPDNMRLPEGRYATGHPSMHDYHEMVPPHLLRWLYKDPSGNIQGPFSPEDMHEWFEGGFFTPSLLVRREDEQMFEPLGILIQRVGDDTKPFLVAAYLPSIQRQPLGFGRDTHSLPNTPVADRYMQHQTGPGKAGFDPFGGPYTSAYEQGSFNFRRPGERQENWQDGFRPEYRGMDQGNNWNNEHLPHPGNNRNIHPTHPQQQQQQQPQMHSGELGMSGLDPDAIRVMMERQRYIQILQQRQQMLMHQFQQPYSPPTQQSPGFQNELLAKLLPHINAGQTNDPMLQTRGMNMNAQLPGWSGPNPNQPNDPEPTSPYRQMENPQFRQNWPHDNAGASVDPRNPAYQNQNPNHFVNDPNAPGPDFQSENVTNQLQENQVANTLEMKDVESIPHSFSTMNIGQVESQEVEHDSSEATLEPVGEEIKEMVHSLANQEEASQFSEGSIPHDETEQVETYNSSSSAPWAIANSSPDMEAESTSDRPSLREIQEIEAKMAEAHKMERQAQLHSELALLQQQEKTDQEASAVVTAAMSGWHNTNAPKKSMLEIQKEEEEATKRKARLEMQSKLAAIAGSAGKRYADTVASGPKTGEGWVTVVGSKNQTDKIATNPVTANKPETANTIKTTPQVQPKLTASDFPLPSMASTITRKKSYQESKPSEEFLKWCRASLKDLNGINVDDFVQMLLTFPLNPPPATLEIISESVYASSTTLDGRRFAHEFIKMRKIDAGLIPGRLGETVKAAEEPEESTISNQGFKVVTKKKGRKH